MENSICKIVYFDEDSVTDYVQIIAGGELEKTTQLLKETDKNVNTDASVSGKAGISGVFKALLGLEAQASADASMGISLNTNKMAKNIVKNTILTDFLGILNDEKQNRKGKISQGSIKKFEGNTISVEKDAVSYIVMVSPYLSMLKGGASVPAGEFDIAIEKLDNALKSAKGYYEFVGTKGKSKVVLRFNINSLKNKITIILTSHYLEEIESLCDQVAILVKGKVVCYGSVQDIKKIGKSDSFENAFINIVEEGEKNENDSLC